MSNNDIAFFAETTFRNEFKKFGIKTDDRRRHMYLIGKTGMGKSTVQENMIIGDIRAGRGVAVVDPHGDLAEKIMEYIPADRVDDVVYFNPADIDFPIAFNVVEQVDSHLQHLVASGLIGVFQKLWADSWGPRLEYILRNAILAILDFPGSTLLGVVRMLSDKGYRKQVVANIKDPVVKAFWEKEFASYADKFASEAVSPIQNKVGQFLSSALMRNIVGQSKSSINLREIMDEGKILIMNLSKGRIGEDNSALLGAMMITKIQLAAMSRVDIPEKERKDFYLYIDEFQNFSTDSFANILSEARKYRLDLILAHQYIEQLSEKVKPAVFGNVGTMISFRVGAADAEELSKEFLPVFSEEDLVNLPKYEMYLKLMIDGVASSPFSAKGLPPLTEEEKTNQEERAINSSREKYASSREVVEEKIMSWHDSYNEDPKKKAPMITNVVGLKNLSDVNKKLNNVTQNTAKNITPPSEEGFQTTCSLCGEHTHIPFKPDGIRPIFCKTCLSKKKEERKLEMEKKIQSPIVQNISNNKGSNQNIQKGGNGNIANHSVNNKNHNQLKSKVKPVIIQDNVKNVCNDEANKNINRKNYSKSNNDNKENNDLEKNNGFNNKPVKKIQPVRPSSFNGEIIPKHDNNDSISLSSLSSLPARDFKGREQSANNQKYKMDLNIQTQPPVSNNDSLFANWPEGDDINEGEVVDFSNK